MKITWFAIGWFGIVSLGMSVVSPSAVAAEKPRLPVVFAHGLGISGEAYELLGGLKSLFGERGHVFLIAKTPVHGNLEERSAVLRREIARLVPSGRLHLVGHSMGGLDARLALQDPSIASRVVSLTTLSTPHHGSALADYVVRQVDEMGDDSILRSLLERMFGDIRSARQLTTGYLAERFNPATPDAPGVKYFSLGFYIPAPVALHSAVPVIWVAHAIQARAGFARNDGMVSVESAKWGVDLGELVGDHYSETSPLPIRGGPSYLEIFGRVINNIESRVESTLD